MIRSTLFNLFFYAFTFAMALAAYAMARLGFRKALWRIVGLWGQITLAAVRVILGARVEIRGLENLPQGGARLFVCKHQSELDIILLASAVPEFGAVAMQELERYPFFGPILRQLDLVLVPVEGARAGRTDEVIAGARRIIDAGRPMVIFPEATLVSLGAKERYRRGAGRIYAALQVEAVPVASSLGVIWPRREWRKHPGRNAAIEVLAPIAPGLDVENFTEEIERRIEAPTMRLVREHAEGDVLAAAEDRHARGVANEE